MTNKIIRRMEHLLFAGCFVCLALFTWTAGERAWFQRLYLQALRDAGDPDATPGLYNAAVSRPGPLGRIEISRASINAAILDGVDAGTLDRAVGHVPGTAYPGPAAGLQFFGMLAITAASRVMSVRLHKLNGDTIYAVDLEPER